MPGSSPVMLDRNLHQPLETPTAAAGPRAGQEDVSLALGGPQAQGHGLCEKMSASGVSAARRRRRGFAPWVRKIPGERNGHPLQYSCLQNPRDRGAWQATIRGGAKELDRTEQLNNSET
ncbi:unnamed protein product [Rangifer tarandus platyrhynchus]|uniref:Uncharacterized protein n=1 Tax=Rangifer tarandus platyrhynchus TaxID=3082113 RepID=A0AC59ZF99_RANTA